MQRCNWLLDKWLFRSAADVLISLILEDQTNFKTKRDSVSMTSDKAWPSKSVRSEERHDAALVIISVSAVYHHHQLFCWCFQFCFLVRITIYNRGSCSRFLQVAAVLPAKRKFKLLILLQLGRPVKALLSKRVWLPTNTTEIKLQIILQLITDE